MNDFDVECNDCGWQGYEMSLESKTESLDDNNYCCCPECGSDDVSDLSGDDDDDFLD